MHQLLVQLRALVRRTLSSAVRQHDDDRNIMPLSLSFRSAPQFGLEQWRQRWSSAGRHNLAFDWATRLALVFILSLMIFANVSWIFHAVTAAESSAPAHLWLNVA